MSKYLLSAALLALSLSLLSCSGGKDNPKPVGPTFIPVTGIALDRTTITLAVNTDSIKETLVATVQPSNATNKRVTWATSNADVVSIANGIVTAIASGTATITATTLDGEKAATCAVTVEGPDVYVGVENYGLVKNGILQKGYGKGVLCYFLHGDDIYVGGYEGSTISNGITFWNAEDSVATIWKNGDIYWQDPTYRTIGSLGITASNDMYVSGRHGDGSLLLKNGVSMSFPSDSLHPYPDSFSVFGNDVFVKIWVHPPPWFSDCNVAYRFLKNGSWMDNMYYLNIWDTEVFVSNNDVYLMNMGSVYKNGVLLHNLEVPKEVAAAGFDLSSVPHVSGQLFVSGNDIYYAANKKTGSGLTGEIYAYLWKNGILQYHLISESSYPDGNPDNTSFTSMAVHGSDVYLSGSPNYVNSGMTQPKVLLWKNGKPILKYSFSNANIAPIFYYARFVYVK